MTIIMFMASHCEYNYKIRSFVGCKGRYPVVRCLHAWGQKAFIYLFVTVHSNTTVENYHAEKHPLSPSNGWKPVHPDTLCHLGRSGSVGGRNPDLFPHPGG